MVLSRVAGYLAQNQAPDWFAKSMNAVGRPGVQAILPLEGAVLAGRSANEAKRSGFLGFQERFIEELVVAAVWLGGVKTLGNLFDKFHTLDSSIDWSAQKLKSVDLTPLERYTPSPQATRGLLRLKGVRFAFSVATTLFVLGVAIPWLNQLKTKWIIDRYFHKPKADTTPNTTKKPVIPPVALSQSSQDWDAMVKSRPLFQTSPTQTSSLQNSSPLATPPLNTPNRGTLSSADRPHTPASTIGITHPSASTQPNPIGGQAATPVFSPVIQPWQPTYAQPQAFPPAPYYYMPPLPAIQPWQPFNTYSQETSPRQGAHTRPVQFGSLLSTAGHLVENTDYGAILVTDLGIMAGRGAVAGKRSPYEAIEVLFRDALSMYFYVLSVPHMMTLMDKLLKPALNAATKMDPAAATAVQERLAQSIKALSNNTVSAAQLSQIIHGQAETPAVQTFHKHLGQWLTSAPLQQGNHGLFHTLKLELSATMGDASRATQIQKALEDIIHQQSLGNTKLMGRYTTTQLSTLLNALEKQRFADTQLAPLANLHLEKDEALRAVRALKQAFRHHAGVEGLQQDIASPFVKLLKTLPPEVQTTVSSQLQKQAGEDSLDLVNSLFRRGLVLSEGELKAEKLAKLNHVASWLEAAANRKAPLEAVIGEELQALGEYLTKESGKVPESLSQAWQQVQQTLSNKQMGSGASAFKTVAAHLRQHSGKAGQTAAQKLSLLEWVFLQNKPFQEGCHSLLNRSFQEMQGANHRPEVTRLLEHYAHQLSTLLRKDGQRVYSLFTEVEGPEVQKKLSELLQGGLKRSNQLVRHALHQTGNLTLDSRLYPHTEKLREMEHHLGDYLSTFIKHLEKEAPQWAKGTSTLSKEALLGSLSQFVKKSQNTRYVAQWVAIPLTMLGLGIFVPKLQFWLTRTLTGKEGHPGINAVHHEEDGKHPAHQSIPAMADTGDYTPLVRSGFQSFQRQQTRSFS